MNLQLKKHFFQFLCRKQKKRVLQQNFIKRNNFTKHVKFNFLCYFNSKHKISLNQKILCLLFINEKGSLFS